MTKITEEMLAAGVVEYRNRRMNSVSDQEMAERIFTAMTAAQDTRPISAAEQNLREHQEQVDMDGIMIGVSRQALDEVLDELERSRAILSGDTE